MRRTTPLTTAGLLGLALLAPTSASTAAAETCRGDAATIVGQEGRPLTGTEGRDVVVTNGATQVETLGGNDLVCVTGKRWAWIAVGTGAGDDFVDGTGSAQPVFADLGTGADVFAGGDGDDRIAVDLADPELRTDALGGGRGRDALTLDAGAADLVVDNEVGTATVGGRVRVTWAALEDFWLRHGGARSLTFVGSSADESVVAEGPDASLLDVDLGAGNDSFEVGVAPLAGSWVRGGGGTDGIEVSSADTDLELDLKRHRMIVAAPTPYYVATPDFEDASLYAPEVVLRGDEGPNALGFTACRAVVKGREGKDVVRRQYDGTFETDLDCKESARIDGGPGNDTLTGTRGADVVNGNGGRDVLGGGNGTDRVFGGPGRDRADGGQGRDRCLAERERRCER